MQLVLLLLVVSATAAVLAEAALSGEEREALIAEAIAEGKEHGRQQSLAREASIQRMKTGQLSSGQMVGRLFKKPTKSARKQGEARVMLDDMVRRAEKKIAEAERHSVGTTQGAEEKAEALAKELFHRPGSMLTSDEIARMTQESGCANVREAPKCFQNLYNIFVRTIDGTCNNFKNPLFGASETKFTRLCPPFYEDGIDSLRGDIQGKTGNLFSLSAYVPPAPSARLISKTIIFRNDSREEDDFTHLLMQWGQFLDHDLDLSPE
ncbi:Peroxidasin, partial [Geodia barretti]